MRLIAKLDVKPPMVVKPVHFEGLRKIDVPSTLAEKYYLDGVDEIFYIDIVASLYKRKILTNPIKKSAEKIFIPFAVGGGIKSISDCTKLFKSGADKIVINTFALQEDPSIIDKAVSMFGSQAVVVSIEAKYFPDGNWYCFSDCGRIPSNKSVLDWCSEIESRGAGEVLLQSVDKDGRKNGFDIELARKVVDLLDIPVVIASGAGNINHIKQLIKDVLPSGIAISSVLHYDLINISKIRKLLDESRNSQI